MSSSPRQFDGSVFGICRVRHQTKTFKDRRSEPTGDCGLREEWIDLPAREANMDGLGGVDGSVPAHQLRRVPVELIPNRTQQSFRERKRSLREQSNVSVELETDGC